MGVFMAIDSFKGGDFGVNSGEQDLANLVNEIVEGKVPLSDKIKVGQAIEQAIAKYEEDPSTAEELAKYLFSEENRAVSAFIDEAKELADLVGGEEAEGFQKTLEGTKRNVERYRKASPDAKKMMGA